MPTYKMPTYMPSNKNQSITGFDNADYRTLSIADNNDFLYYETKNGIPVLYFNAENLDPLEGLEGGKTRKRKCKEHKTKRNKRNKNKTRKHRNRKRTRRH